MRSSFGTGSRAFTLVEALVALGVGAVVLPVALQWFLAGPVSSRAVARHSARQVLETRLGDAILERSLPPALQEVRDGAGRHWKVEFRLLAPSQGLTCLEGKVSGPHVPGLVLVGCHAPQ